MPPAREPLFLAVDIGTSSVRTALFDGMLRRVPGSLTQRAYPLNVSDAGAAELDVVVLEERLRQCLDATVPRAGRRDVAAIGVSSFWHSLIGSDSGGKALTPIYTWADSRCRPDAARLRGEMSEEAYHALTGCMLRASYWPAKLRWLARTNRGLYRRVARWHSPANWIESRFCENGGAVTAHGMATGTGLYDPNTLAWDEGLMARCGLRQGQLAVIEPAPLVLRESEKRRYPQLRHARWWHAIGDGAASNLGSGAAQPGTAAINVGTSAAFREMRTGAKAQSPFGLFCYRVDGERFLVGGAVSNAGNLRAWCHRELKLPVGSQALETALAARPEPIRGLVVLPFWSAERAPTWCEELGGVLTGLTQNTSALDILQATTEAVYQRLALITDLSLSHPAGGDSIIRLPLTKISVSGGILKSASLVQRLADVLGRPLHPCAEPEASLRGAAVYAAEREGVYRESASVAVAGKTESVRPRRRYRRHVRLRAKTATAVGRNHGGSRAGLIPADHFARCCHARSARFARMQSVGLPSHRRRSAFTLIELLVVIVIIGVLVGISLPMYKAVTERSRQMKTLSNMRQIGVGFMLYAGDNNNQLPARVTGTSDKWPKLLSIYVQNLLVYNSPIPSYLAGQYQTTDPTKLVDNSTNYTSYIANGYNDVSNGDLSRTITPPRLSVISSPSSVILLGIPYPKMNNFYMDFSEGMGNNNGVLDKAPWSDGSIYVFTDGSSRFLKYRSMDSMTSKPTSSANYTDWLWLINKDNASVIQQNPGIPDGSADGKGRRGRVCKRVKRAIHRCVLKIGVISDTHGLLRPEAEDVLWGCDRIIHGGDVGNEAILARLSQLAPLLAVRGNVDRGEWAESLPPSETVIWAGVRIHVVHDKTDLEIDPGAVGIQIVISGHSHRPAVEEKDSVTYLNPGSAGRRRFPAACHDGILTPSRSRTVRDRANPTGPLMQLLFLLVIRAIRTHFR